uniref:Ankyrin repeat domain-containing protein 33 n=1 Tax=Catharus ustulatus TaxID=91951 RepID=A0A8C3UXA0_CATUS
MKAAVQGQRDCVTALLLAGADLQAVDAVKGKTAREWAIFTGRFDTTVRIRTLLRRPRAEQFGSQYQPEWPALAELVAKALSPKSRSKRLSEKIRSIFTFNIPRDPEEDGVLDHMVRMTTSLASPFVATACQTVCPDSPPEVGKHRLSVPEILGQHVPDAGDESETSSRPSTGGSSCNGHEPQLQAQAGNRAWDALGSVSSCSPELQRCQCCISSVLVSPHFKIPPKSAPSRVKFGLLAPAGWARFGLQEGNERCHSAQS